jgi:hypothetical protein
MRGPRPGMSAASSGSRRNRRGEVAIEFELGLFMLHILAPDAPAAFGPKSKMWVVRLY